jgi:plastocyanin
MAYAAIALAASDTIATAGPASEYSQPTYNTDQGAVVSFQNQGVTHNVTARQIGPDGKALFRTPTFSNGTLSVDGTQYLPAGDYAFFCTVHPTTMNATLHVTGNGTPQARPSATAKLRTRKISKALKGVMVDITASTKIDGATVTAKLGKTKIGKAAASLFAGAQTVRVKLSKSGKGKLAKKSSAKVSVTVDIPFGTPATAKSKLT